MGKKSRSIFAGTVAALGLAVSTSAAQANTWDFEGEILTCLDFVCALAGIGVGDTLAGFVQADDAASGPGSSFGPDDITDYAVIIQDLVVGAADGMIDSAMITVGVDGELDTGNLALTGTFDTPLGPAAILLAIDITNRTWTVSTDLLGLGEVAAGSIQFALEPDGDDVASIVDNCTQVANPDQIDADNDGIGNICDADLSQNCSVSFEDLGELKERFFTNDPVADFNSNGSVSFEDLGTMKASFFMAPGPAAAPNLCTP